MRVLVKSGFSLGGERHAAIGELIELPDDEAEIKVRRGWVVPAPPETTGGAGSPEPPATTEGGKKDDARGARDSRRH